MEFERYDALIENIKSLPLSEKEELKSLIEKYIIEERRNEIEAHYKKSLSELKKGKLQFSSDIKELKDMLEQE
ncbi:hypothetical protein [Desulfonauticus submarinus]